MRYRFLVFATALVMANIAVAQARTSSKCDSSTCKITLTFGPDGIPNSAIAAYSGRQSREIVRIGADGTRFIQPVFLSTMTYRDSLGRLWTERDMFPSRPGAKPAVDIPLIEIQDPQAGYLYVLDSFHQVAHRVQVHPPQPVARPAFGYIPPTPARAGDPEPLGQEFMFGVLLTGQKRTSASRMRNGESFTSVTEIWADPRTNVEVLRRITGPQGEYTKTLENYSNAEPDSALFLIPPGYQIVDETGPVTFEIPRSGK